jgi:hypothetical protein
MKRVIYIAILATVLGGCASGSSLLIDRLRVGTSVQVNDTVSICIGAKDGTSLRHIQIGEMLPIGMYKVVHAESGSVDETPQTGVAVLHLRNVEVYSPTSAPTNIAEVLYEVRYRKNNQPPPAN